MITLEQNQQGLEKKDFLLAECDGCGAKDTLYNPLRRQHECTKCSVYYDTTYLAKKHLCELLIESQVLSEWLKHYRTRGIDKPEARYILEDSVEKVLDHLWEQVS